MKTDVDVTGPINIGNPAEFTMIELAEMITKLTNSSSPIKHLPLPQDDPKQRQPDITLARNTLGWEPKIPLEEGLKKTIAYFEQHLRNNLHAFDAVRSLTQSARSWGPAKRAHLGHYTLLIGKN